jgi:5-oxoprolinase (ATP-hydrolysing) subunit C
VTLLIQRAGPLTTIQDAGRHGYLRFGVTLAGPMDWMGFATANRLIGNRDGAAVVEIGPAGIDIRAETAQRVAIAAPGFRVRLDGQALSSRLAVTLPTGAGLQVLPGSYGMWGYLALPGGIAGEPVMGSLATHLRSGLGRPALQPGDRLDSAGRAEGPTIGLYPPAARDDGPIRFIPGPQEHAFDADGMALFARATFTLSSRSDRMAYRLSGPAITAAKGHDIVSDGIPMGAIQVPGDGQPLVLMADRQPTGGYPKIGVVIRADLPRLAQTRPGQPVRFAAVTHAQAVAALETSSTALDDQFRHQRLIRFHRWD